MLAHLSIGGEDNPAPWEFTSLYLCRDVYHCRPSDLRKENWRDITEHLTCLNAEAQYKEQENNRQQPKQEAL